MPPASGAGTSNRSHGLTASALRYRSGVLQPLDEPERTRPLIPPLRATAIVGLGSVVALGISVLTMKAYALLIGPDGVGLLALMQSVLNLAVIVTSLGATTAAIGALAAALARRDQRLAQLIEQAVVVVGIAGSGVGAVLLVLFREPLARTTLGSQELSGYVLLLAPALLFSVAALTQTAFLMGAHQIRAVTAVNVGTSVAAAGFGIPLVAAFGTDALAASLALTAAVQFGLCLLARSRTRRGDAPVAAGFQMQSAVDLLRVGLPITGSQLVSSGAVLAVPILILSLLGGVDVGYYRAAAAISVGYMTFFLAALTQDYLPRISAASTEGELAVLVERRMRLLLGLGMPVIFGLLAVTPFVIDVLYTREFAPAAAILEWHLVGDLLRLPAWVLAYVLLARKTTGHYFSAELVAGIALLGGTFVGVAAIGLVGAGLGYAVSQAIYYLFVWQVVRRRVATTPGRLQAFVVIAAVGSSVALMLGFDSFVHFAVFGILSMAIAGAAWPRLYRLHRLGEL
jgi:antigen flippase